jgi:hypothetical protein
MHIDTDRHICTYIQVYMAVNIYRYTHTHTHTHLYICVCVHTYMCVCVYYVITVGVLICTFYAVAFSVAGGDSDLNTTQLFVAVKKKKESNPIRGLLQPHRVPGG